MTLNELVSRFPEIPTDLHQEPILARLAETCGELLAHARKPTACSQENDPANHYYLKLIGPLSIYGYGLSSRDKVLGQIRALVEAREADPEGFAAGLLPEDTVPQEVRGPGCD